MDRGWLGERARCWGSELDRVWGREPRSGETGSVEAAARLGGNRACLAIARKLLKRSYHTLRELGQEALAPA